MGVTLRDLDAADACAAQADTLTRLTAERDEARAEAAALEKLADLNGQAAINLRAEAAAARAQVATLREACRRIANYRSDCLRHDADMGHEPRSFDVEDVRLMEAMAASVLRATELHR